MRFAFCCNAGSGIGGGHAYRCLALADMLAELGGECLFLTTSETVETVAGLSRHSIILLSRRFENNEISSLCSEMARSLDGRVSWLVCDSYEIDAEFEIAARAWAENILVLDDLANRPHECDMLVDAGPGRQKRDYLELTPQDANVLVGPRHAILRPEFPWARDLSLARRKKETSIKRALVNFGALDGKNMTPMALRALGKCDLKVSVDVILGGGAKNKDEVYSAVEQVDLDITVHVAPEKIGPILAEADFTLGAAGSSVWERCYLGVPSLLITTAEDQKRTAAQLNTLGAAILVGDWATVTSDQISESWQGMILDSKRVTRMSQLSSSLCDGLGVSRIIDQLVGSHICDHTK